MNEVGLDSLVQGFSQCLGIILVASVHPDQPWSSLASPANLDEDQVPSLACPPHLVPVPCDDGVGGVCGADDVQLAHGDVGDATAQGQDVEAQDAPFRAHLLGEDVYRPN